MSTVSQWHKGGSPLGEMNYYLLIFSFLRSGTKIKTRCWGNWGTECLIARFLLLCCGIQREPDFFLYHSIFKNRILTIGLFYIKSLILRNVILLKFKEIYNDSSYAFYYSSTILNYTSLKNFCRTRIFQDS